MSDDLVRADLGKKLYTGESLTEIVGTRLFHHIFEHTSCGVVNHCEEAKVYLYLCLFHSPA